MNNKDLGIIQSITEIQDGELVVNNINYSGYKVITDQTEIMLVISREREHFEDWGYIFSEGNNPVDFIGAEIKEVELPEYDTFGSAATQYMHIATDKGSFALSIYNNNINYSHNILAAIGSEVILEEII